MIAAEEAARITGAILGRPADDPDHGWQLDEFPQGWYVRQFGWEGYRGGASLVIERDTGQARSFGSYLPPNRLIEEYEALREEGYPEDMP